MSKDIPTRLDYRGKMILAPMVKVGTLPTRLLALEYGADIVYTEEIIDKRLLATERVVNKHLDTIDYVDKRDGSLVFRTCQLEKSRLVLQIGTADGDRAAAAAKMVEQDVSGIDVNMGCPKSFSIKGGMGAALITQPEKVRDILTKLVAAVNIPVTAKIRLVHDSEGGMEATLSLVNIIKDCGVAALGVHGRTKHDRPNNPNSVSCIRQIVDHLPDLPVIANGGSSNNRNSPDNTNKGILNFWRETGASSVMVARAAEWNPSVFREGEKDDRLTVIGKYLSYAIKFDYPFNIVKYCLAQLMGNLQTESEQGRYFLETSTLQDICRVFGREQEYLNRQQVLVGEENDIGRNNAGGGRRKRKSEDDGGNVTEKFSPFVRGHYGVNESNRLPKSLVLLYARQHGLTQPVYNVEQQDKMFRATVTIGDVGTFSSKALEKNKKYAEQGAALVAIQSLGITQENVEEQVKKARIANLAAKGKERTCKCDGDQSNGGTNSYEGDQCDSGDRSEDGVDKSENGNNSNDGDMSQGDTSKDDDKPVEKHDDGVKCASIESVSVSDNNLNMSLNLS